jgi:hypothetical protein
VLQSALLELVLCTGICAAHFAVKALIHLSEFAHPNVLTEITTSAL